MVPLTIFGITITVAMMQSIIVGVTASTIGATLSSGIKYLAAKIASKATKKSNKPTK